MCVCVCVYIYTYTYIHTYIHTYLIFVAYPYQQLTAISLNRLLCLSSEFFSFSNEKSQPPKITALYLKC